MWVTPDVPEDVDPDEVEPADVEGEELCVDGEELCVDGEDDDVLATELAVDADDVLAGVVCLTFGLGFAGGACSAGTAPAFVNGVMTAACALAELDCASDPVGAGGADVFLTTDPMANAATSPTTSAAASSSQRLRTS